MSCARSRRWIDVRSELDLLLVTELPESLPLLVPAYQILERLRNR